GAEDLDYWDLIAFLNIDLCLLLIIEDQKIETKWNEVIQNFKKVLQKAGSEAKKAAELEHLEFLTHSLNVAAGLNGEVFKPQYDLETRINELRTALRGVRKKLKSESAIKAKPKAASSKPKPRPKPKPKSKPKK